MSDDDFEIVTRKRSAPVSTAARKVSHAAIIDDCKELDAPPVSNAEALAKLRRLAAQLRTERAEAEAAVQSFSESDGVSETICQRMLIIDDLERMHDIVMAESESFLAMARTGIYAPRNTKPYSGLATAINEFGRALCAWQHAETEHHIPAATATFCARAQTSDALLPLLEGIYLATLLNWDGATDICELFRQMQELLLYIPRAVHTQAFADIVCKKHAIPFLEQLDGLDERVLHSTQAIEPHLNADHNARLASIVARFTQKL